MTEFEKFWEKQDQTQDKDFAEKVWHAAQRAVLRTMHQPPYVPVKGDTVKFLTLCHPSFLGMPVEVTDVTKDTLHVYWVTTKRIVDDRDIYSCGILGEVACVSAPVEAEKQIDG